MDCTCMCICIQKPVAILIKLQTLTSYIAIIMFDDFV